MKNNNRAETLISILIGIVIIVIISFGTIEMIDYDKQKSLDYDKINEIFLLETNSNNLIKKIDTKIFKEKEVFYLYKTGSQILAYSGANNDYMKYVNSNGDLVTNTGSYDGNIYTRIFMVDKDTATTQLIKGGIKELIKK
ncbi:MAG: hypothetical protein PHG82_04040 [Candidatus Gracilibacteria bacterium]|nr:hypothetical protein [Candidatus Gracilibacteria bacterium]